MTSSSPKSVSPAEYEWLTARDAVLRRPDTYIGAVHPRRVQRTVLDVGGSPLVVECDEVSPALEKLFDEILTNAIDHRERDAAMTHVKVSLEDDGSIHVSNDGSKTIPTGAWPGTDVPTPQVLFHELHAGSNLGETNAHRVGGRNGVGATVTNLFSRWFEVHIDNAEEGVSYVQRYEDNGRVVGAPRRKTYRKKTAHTTVAFLPDYERLGMSLPLSDQARALLIGRAVDASACTAAMVYVNGTKLASLRSLRHYALAYGGEVLGTDSSSSDGGGDSALGDGDATSATAAAHVRVVATSGVRPAVHACFVNGVRCGGTLYDAVLKQVASSLAARAGSSLAARQVHGLVSEHVSLFIVARIHSPSFGSQSKDVLDTPVAKLGVDVPSCTALSKRVERLDAVQSAVRSRQDTADGAAARKTLRETGRHGRNVPKYERATELGRTKQPCTLYVTEGDSAKAMVVSGFSVIGRKHNGVFPLRGKLLNTYDVKIGEAMKNEEIASLVSILGLVPGKEYDVAAVRKLPYARLMVMTDQDHDGSHIKGLLLTFFVRHFPSLLLASPEFVGRFVTPVIRLRLSGERGGAWRDFFSVSEHHRWLESDGVGARVAETRYYKGLGTSTAAEAMDYFSDLQRHTVVVDYAHDAVGSDAAMRECFGKDRAQVDARREMLRHVDPASAVDYAGARVTVDDFCRKELVHFFAADNRRSIPSAVDGLKPSQRKVLFTLLSGAADRRHKVAQLSGDVARTTAYHHGEQSLANVIVNMSQDFVGANNINLLEPKGQFGNRHGEKPAAARYIFTCLSSLARLVFRAEDDSVLERLQEEGTVIEPSVYVPVVPLVLVNGAEGIGTGFSTQVPPHSPYDVIDCCRRVACELPDDAGAARLVPWVRGYTGTIAVDERGSVVYEGRCTWNDDDAAGDETDATSAGMSRVARITELPPGTRTNDVRAHIQALDGVDEVVSHSNHDTVDLYVHMMPGKPKLSDAALKMRSRQTLNNMHLYDEDGTLRAYATAHDILLAHARVRLRTYDARLRAAIDALERKREVLAAKDEYARRVLSGEVDPLRTRRADLVSRLGPHGRTLLAMTCAELTPDGADERREALEILDAKLAEARKTTARQAWCKELDELEAGLRAHDAARAKEAAAAAEKHASRRSSASAKQVPKSKRPRGSGAPAGAPSILDSVVVKRRV